MLTRWMASLLFTYNMDSLPLPAIIVLISLIVTLIIGLIVAAVYTVYSS